MSASNGAIDPPRVGNSNTIFKSGHLLVSWKGLGWMIWKKRWFVLTRTSLVFFKNDPSALPQSDGEVNLTLGGIDLNNSGSVVVREDKKLLTVLFPDVRDGRAFTLKAETSEDLLEWKTALENALAQAPNAALVMEQNEIFRSDTNDSTEGSFHQNPNKSDGMYFHLGREKRPVKSLVIGRPILLALEDIDGGPSFLEKALQFLEKYGVKVEGILRQSADVEEVDKRVQEYEQGKTKFYPSEDAHVIGDCVKHILRELPSSPVPAACCTAMLEAFKIDSMEARVTAMRTVIQEAFPEPNRRLLQRVLKMMRTISSHASENRMTQSVVAVCMAPLLLRPLVAGECELEDDYDTNGDDSSQILAAASAANNAQAIITMLLEQYENIFDDNILRRWSMSVDSQTDNSESENSSNDQNPNRKSNGYHDAHSESGRELRETDFDSDRRHSGKLSQSSGSAASDLYDYKATINDDSDYNSPTQNRPLEMSSNPTLDPRARNESVISVNGQLNPRGDMTEILRNESQRSVGKILSSLNQKLYQSVPIPELLADKAFLPKPISPNTTKKSTFWGKKNSRKTASSESIDFSGEEELAIQRLETAKNDLRQRIAKEARGNAILQASLERRKQALHERRLALEQDVARLQEQLQAERDLRAALEVGLSISPGQFSSSRHMDSKTRVKLEEIALAEADVARLKQKVAELHHQLNQQRQHQYKDRGDFDTTLAVCNNERKQRTETIRDSISTEASTSSSMDDAVNSAPLPSRASEAAVSLTLVELTNRLDFFRERRSQLMEQLNNLDPNLGSIHHHHEFLHKPSSPP